MTAQFERDGNSDRVSSDGRRVVSIGAVLSAMALVVIDAGGLNLSLASIAHSLHIDASTAILVVTAYQLAVVMALLPSAALGERFGLRRVFATGVITFIVGAAMAAASASLPWLLLARFIQGLGASAILALGVAVLRSTVSDRLLGAAIGWNALTVALAAAAGPVVGALVLSKFNWNWLFVFELPLGLSVLLAARALPTVAPNSENLDYAGITLNFAAFGLLILGINLAALRPAIAACVILASAPAFVTIVARETNKPRPLLPLDLLRSPSFRNSILASVLCFIGQTAGLIALPFHLQDGLGLSPPVAGLYMSVWPLSVAGTAYFAGRLSRWASTSALCAIGGALLALGMFAVACLQPRDPNSLMPFMMASGIGFGLFQVANNRNIFLAAPIARSGAAGGMQGTARLLGQSGGAALVAQLFASFPMKEASPIVLGVAAVFALSAGVISIFRADTP